MLVCRVHAFSSGLALGSRESAKTLSFFAWVSVADDPTGVFSDNLVTVLPGEPTILRYRPGAPTTAASLRRRLSLLDLRGSS